MNPLQMGGVNIPFTEELFHQTKKMLKNSEAAKTVLGEASDVYTPSEAARQLPSSPQEKFLSEAKSEISKMDPTSEGFVQQATSALVDSALGQVFGSKISKNPGYPQMNAKITKKLLEEYSDVIGEFLAGLVQAKKMGLDNAEAADAVKEAAADVSYSAANYEDDGGYPVGDEEIPDEDYAEEKEFSADADLLPEEYDDYSLEEDYERDAEYPPEDEDLADDGAYDEDLSEEDYENDYGDAEYYSAEEEDDPLNEE